MRFQQNNGRKRTLHRWFLKISPVYYDFIFRWKVLKISVMSGKISKNGLPFRKSICRQNIFKCKIVICGTSISKRKCCVVRRSFGLFLIQIARFASAPTSRRRLPCAFFPDHRRVRRCRIRTAATQCDFRQCGKRWTECADTSDFLQFFAEGRWIRSRRWSAASHAFHTRRSFSSLPEKRILHWCAQEQVRSLNE